MKDGYDKQIEFLRENPLWIETDWQEAEGLFAFASQDGNALPVSWARDKGITGSGAHCGCLTMIRNGRAAATEDLTMRIRADERIPDDPADITVEHLEVFAEWQRILDKELGREPYKFSDQD